jgi:hypothetical protein
MKLQEIKYGKLVSIQIIIKISNLNLLSIKYKLILIIYKKYTNKHFIKLNN